MASLTEIAEEPGLWLPDDGLRELFALDGLVVAAYGGSLAAERIRLRDDEVERGVREVRELARARRATEVQWWLGTRSAPAAIEEHLLALGLVHDPGEPVLTTLTIERRPAREPVVEVRRVETFEDYLRALEIDWDVFDQPPAVRAQRRQAAPAQWERLAASPGVTHHLALVDGAPAAFARTVYTPVGGLMLGGATLPHARGRGAYTSLVHARWAEAAARGTPALGTAAGSMSGPVLRGLGFREQGRVRLLLDRL